MSGADVQPPIAILADRPCDWVRELLSRSHAHIDVFASAWELRKALLGEVGGVRRVLIGEVERPSPINVAAAIAKDGRALSVTLVVDVVTGSLRSRAFQAGITDVMDVDTAIRTFSAGSALHLPAEDGMGEGERIDAPRPFREVPTGPGVREGGSDLPSSSILPDPYGSAILPDASTHGDVDEGDREAGGEGFGPKVVLISGRGGVGKTAVCALMAATAAAWGLDVALVDLDLGFGNLFGYFGLDGPADLTRLGRCEGVTELGLCGKRADERIALFGPCAKPEYAETVAPKVTEMLDALAEAHDLVLVDGGTSWGDGVAQAVQAADRLLVCTDERAGAIGTLARAGSLAIRLGVARTRICQLINRCDPKRHDEGFLDRAAEGFRSARAFHIQDGGVEVGEVLSVGRVVDLVNVANPFAESVAQSLGTLLAELGILPEDDRALKAIGARRGPGSRRGDRIASPSEGRWAA